MVCVLFVGDIESSEMERLIDAFQMWRDLSRWGGNGDTPLWDYSTLVLVDWNIQ